jgi:hypothetical protein
MLTLEYDKLFDKFTEVEHNNKETNLRYAGIERSYYNIEKEK